MTPSYHFIGIGGIGMSGLARLLLDQGLSVSGSDIASNVTIEELVRLGALIYKGQKKEHVPRDAIVVYSSDIQPDNPEYQAAIDFHLPLLHRSDLLSELVKNHRSLAITGTHGKTTTASLLATTLMKGGEDPSFAIGGILSAFHTNARLGKGKDFVFEADESDRSFLKYHPFGAIVTNIDRDHLNYYEGREERLVEAFRTFMSQVHSSSHLFWCGDDPFLRTLNRPGQRYGFDPLCEWRIQDYHQMGFKLFFDLEHNGKLYPAIELLLVGEHNVLNGAAVFGLALTLGVDEENIREAFKTFQGVLRRCERKGFSHDVLFLDDYAHHPTEIAATLKGIRQAIGEHKRLIAVFQPHRYSRTLDCLGSYGTIFDAANEIVLTDIYGAGEAPIPHLSHRLIEQEIAHASKVSCQYVPRSALSHFLKQFVRPNDVVVTLGAGDVTKVGLETLALMDK